MANKNVITGAIPNLELPAPPARRTRIKTITPLYDRVLLRQLADNAQTRTGLYVPNIANEQREWARGEVVAVGGGRVTLEGHVVPLQVKAGDIVLYPRKAGQPIPLGDDDGSSPWILIREPDILGGIELEEVPIIEVVDASGRPQ